MRIINLDIVEEAIEDSGRGLLNPRSALSVRLVAIIHISDEADYDDEELTRTVNTLLDEGHRTFRVNCEQAAVLDSAGLGNVVRCYTAVSRRGGEFKLEKADHLIRNLLGPFKLTRLFEMSGNPFIDPFDPRVPTAYWQAAMVTGGAILLLVLLRMFWAPG